MERDRRARTSPRACASLCHFGQMNLLDDERTRLARPHATSSSAATCSSISIAHARRRVIDMFHERLVPGRRPLARSLRVAVERDRPRSSCYTCAKTSCTESRSGMREARGGDLSDKTAPAARRRRLRVQPAQHRRHLRGSARGRGRRQGRRRRRGAAPRDAAQAGRHHARPRDAAHGRLHVPAHPDVEAADAGDRRLVSYSQKENVFKALELGALDFVAKPDRQISPDATRAPRADPRRRCSLVRHAPPKLIRLPPTRRHAERHLRRRRACRAPTARRR